MNIRDTSTLHHVEVNILSKTITLCGHDGESLVITENASNEFTRMCAFINKTLPDDMIEYIY